MGTFVDFQSIKERVSIERAASLLGLALKPAGAQLRGVCPACKSDDRSLVVTPPKGVYYCFRGKTGGDCISLVAHVKGIPVRQAAEFLSGGTVTGTGTSNSTSSPTAPQKPEAGANRPFDPEAYAGALKKEGLEALGLTSEVCERWKCGLASKGVLRGRLAIPVCDTNGAIIGFIGRSLAESHYAFPNGFNAADHIFGVEKLQAGEVRILTDPLQVIVASENGVQAVAFLTDTVTPLQLETLASILDIKGCEVIF